MLWFFVHFLAIIRGNRNWHLVHGITFFLLFDFIVIVIAMLLVLFDVGPLFKALFSQVNATRVHLLEWLELIKILDISLSLDGGGRKRFEEQEGARDR